MASQRAPARAPARAVPPAPPVAAADSAKRRQILEGARRAFLAHGFDGASMGDVVSASGVSKATVYAYFESKEKLFETLIFEERRSQAEQLFSLDCDDHDVAKALNRLGCAFMSMMTRPESVCFLRVIIAAAAKFPELGRTFFEAGPAYGRDQLTAYLKAQVQAGVLVIEDPQHAAQQFMELCKTGITVPMLLGVKPSCSEDEVRLTVRRAVDVFVAAYGCHQGRKST